jgi:hypothetical protein
MSRREVANDGGYCLVPVCPPQTLVFILYITYDDLLNLLNWISLV